MLFRADADTVIELIPYERLRPAEQRGDENLGTILSRRDRAVLVIHHFREDKIFIKMHVPAG